MTGNNYRLDWSERSLESGKAVSGEVMRAGIPPWSGVKKKKDSKDVLDSHSQNKYIWRTFQVSGTGLGPGCSDEADSHSLDLHGAYSLAGEQVCEHPGV